MKSRLFIPLALALGFSGTAFGEGADQQQQRTQSSAGSAYAAETMEHVETSTYAVPEVATEKVSAANIYLIEEQNRERYRQEMLQDHNRRTLLHNVRSTQMQQLEVFLQEGESEQKVVQESVPQLPQEVTTPSLESTLPAMNEEAGHAAPAEARMDEYQAEELQAEELQVEEDQAGELAQEPS